MGCFTFWIVLKNITYQAIRCSGGSSVLNFPKLGCCYSCTSVFEPLCIFRLTPCLYFYLRYFSLSYTKFSNKVSAHLSEIFFIQIIIIRIRFGKIPLRNDMFFNVRETGVYTRVLGRKGLYTFLVVIFSNRSLTVRSINLDSFTMRQAKSIVKICIEWLNNAFHFNDFARKINATICIPNFILTFSV